MVNGDGSERRNSFTIRNWAFSIHHSLASLGIIVMFRPPGSIRAVLFDAVGTLIRPQPSVGAAYLAAARRLGRATDWSEDEVARRFRVAFGRQESVDRAAGWATSERRERERWQAIVGEVFDGEVVGEAAAGDGLFAALWDHFADAGNWSVMEAAAAWIDEARRMGLIVGVASNFDERLHGILTAMPELGVDESVFVSSEIGWRKPSLAFFRAIEKRLGLAAGELMLIGDDVHNDVEAAREAGWHGDLLIARA